VIGYTVEEPSAERALATPCCVLEEEPPLAISVSPPEPPFPELAGVLPELPSDPPLDPPSDPPEQPASAAAPAAPEPTRNFRRVTKLESCFRAIGWYGAEFY